MSDTYFCRQILHDGDGLIGPEKKMLETVNTRLTFPGEAAEFFAWELLDKKMRELRVDEEDIGTFHGCFEIVEVRRADSEDWQRYIVTNVVEIKQYAKPARCLKCGWPLHADLRHGCTAASCFQRTKQ